MAFNGPIVIVEDDADDQSLLHEILTESGIESEIISFPNGEEAFRFLISGSVTPALIISDINMPLMNGVELRRRIHEHDELRKKCIPFVFLTTTAEPVTVSIAYKMGVQGFFEKKTTYEALRHQLNHIIGYWSDCLQPSSFTALAKKF